MASEQSRGSRRFDLDLDVLTPDDVRSYDLPLAMRGYDRERVDRLLARVADAYAMSWENSRALRERLRSLEVELVAAQGEAEASARAVAELMQRSPATEDRQSPQTGEELGALQARLERSEAERERTLEQLRQATVRVSELEGHLAALEEAQRARPQQQDEAGGAATPLSDDEAARLLVAAARAADDVRGAARSRALRTLTKARELAALVQAQTERERAELAEAQQRRGDVERETEEIRRHAREEADRAASEIQQRRAEAAREADEIVARARAEAERTADAMEEERDRVRHLLVGALASIEAEVAKPPSTLMVDLESRLNEHTDQPSA
jgi:DivIVA domain-containing protein